MDFIVTGQAILKKIYANIIHIIAKISDMNSLREYSANEKVMARATVSEKKIYCGL